jgi:hypothetical protein
MSRRYACRRLALLIAIWVSIAGLLHAEDPLPIPPDGDDYSHESLRRYQQQLTAHFGHYRKIPLEVKADYFTWELWRYHRTSFHQIYNRALLADRPGVLPQIYPDRDASTWNGSLLAAMSYEYAVKKDAATLARIGEFLRGMHFFFEVTGQPGLPARCVNRADGIIHPEMKPRPYEAADGTQYFFEADPAKGGYNQIAGGYAALMMHVYRDLSPELQRLVSDDVSDLVMHVIDHDYQPTDRDGRPTTYGNMKPLVGTQGVPFNAQVAYEIVALGYSFPPADPAKRARIADQFRLLRGEHHVYFEEPWNLVQPQRVGVSPFIKGMNDRNHVVNAAFVGLALELDYARRHGEAFNEKFMYQLGQTIALAIQHPDMQRHSLGQFMWAGILRQPGVFDAMVKHKPNSTRAALEQGLSAGVEQLQRFQLDRFLYPGREYESKELVWNDNFRPDDSYWKINPRLVFQTTGPSTSDVVCAMDYLYAYWLYRYYGLDRAEGAKPATE